MKCDAANSRMLNGFDGSSTERVAKVGKAKNKIVENFIGDVVI